MLSRLALGSGRRVSTSRRLDLDVICFSNEKIFRVDAAAFTRFMGKREATQQRDTPFSGYTMRKRRVALLRRATVKPLYMTHPSEVGSTSQLTLLAAVLRGLLSHPICRRTTAFCRF